MTTMSTRRWVTRISSVVALAALMGVASATAVQAAAPRPAIPWDFDGDGRADLAIGSPGESIGTVGGAGAVTLLKGTSTGLVAPGRSLTLSTPGVPGSPAAGDAYGSALASADFDGDGRADLAISAPGRRNSGGKHPGVVDIHYGTRAGLTTARTVRLTPLDVSDNGFGSVLATGDFNGDDYADLAVTSQNQYADGLAAGSVTIYYGSAAGILTARASRFGDGTPADDDWFGHALAVGDYNGDGLADLAVSGGDEPSTNIHNTVQVYLGRTSGLTTKPFRTFRQEDADLAVANVSYSFFGWRLAAGDTDGDGYDELMISDSDGGAPDETGCADRASCSGLVLVLLGGADGPTAAGRRVLWGRQPGAAGPSSRGVAFGWRLAAGDLNGDGRSDLAVSSTYSTPEAYGAGAVTVFYGSSKGLTTRGSQLWWQNAPGVRGTAEEFDAFGSSTSIADVGGTKAADLIVGAPGESIGSVPRAGCVQVLFGTASGVTADKNQLWSQHSPKVSGTAEQDDAFGTLR